MAQTVYVSTAAQLRSAVSSANTDTTFVLKAGNYGHINLIASQQKHLADHHLTFVSENANKPAVITGLDAVGLKSGLTFDGIHFDYNAAKGAHQSYKWNRIENSKNITVKNSIIDGDEAHGLSRLDDGYPTGSGIFFRYNDGITFENNEVFQFFRGTTFQNSNNITVKDNEFYDMSSDALNFAAVKNVVIEDNYLHDYRSHPNTYAHRDMIQFWTQNENTPTHNVVIRGNVMDAGSGLYTQSIWINNEAMTKQGAGSNMLYRNFVIEDNVIRNAHKHGIAVNNIDGLKINNNTIVRADGIAPDESPQYTPVININIGSRNVTINDNVIHGVNGKNWSGNGNLEVQRQWTTESNHFKHLFVNGLSDDLGTWEDLMSLPGGIIEKKGVGSKLLKFDTTPSQVTPLMLSDDGEQLARHHHTFDVSNVYGPSGKISTKGASVQWDFGDGKSGSGLNPTHVYTKPGTYEATATIKLANGKTVTADKVVEVETPILLQADFQNGAKDISGFQNSAKAQNVSYVNDGGSKVAKFTKTSYIRYNRSEELFNNEGITLLADFRKDQLSDTGRLINFSDALIVKITNNGFQITVTTDQANKMFDVHNAGINNTAWHRLAVTWDEKTDKAVVYVDGKQIGSPISIKGTQVAGNVSQDFSIGSNFKDAFSGLVDNVSFLGGAMNASEVSSLHSGHKTLDKILNTSAGSTGSSLPTIDTKTNYSSNNNNSNDTAKDTTPPPTPPTVDETPSTGTSASSSSGSVDTGTWSNGVRRYDMDNVNDAVLIKGSVSKSDLEILLGAGKVKINTDKDSAYEHIIDLKKGVFNNGSFETTKVSGGTLVTFQPAGGGSSTVKAPSSSGGTQAASATGDLDTGSYTGGAWRYDMNSVNDVVKVWSKNVSQKDLDLSLKWGKLKINTDKDAAYEHIIDLKKGVFNNGSFKTEKVSDGTLISFEPAGGSSSSSSKSSNSSGSSGSNDAPTVTGDVKAGTYTGGAWRYKMNSVDDAAKIWAKGVTQKDLDLLLKWGKLKIDSDNDGKYEHIIDLKKGVFNNGSFETTNVSDGTLITFEPAGGGASGVKSSGSSSSSSSKSSYTNNTKAKTDYGSKEKGVWRYEIDTNDTARIRAKIDEKDLEVLLKWDRVKINTDRDAASEHIIELRGNGFDNGIFKTKAGPNNTTLVTFEPAGGDSSGNIVSKSYKKKGVEYFTLSSREDQVYIDEKISLSDLEVQRKWDKIKIDNDDDGRVDFQIKLEGNFWKGDFVTTPSGSGTLIGFQSDNFDFG